uniref:transposase n=1 Tax=Bradyrhizobium archetypum TaxID=2721160 RepID=UPI0035DD57A0
MERQRRSFTEEYKRQAVELVVSSRRSVTSVAKELGLRDSAALGRQVPPGAGIGGVAPHHAGDANVGGPGFGDRPAAPGEPNGCAWSATF